MNWRRAGILNIGRSIIRGGRGYVVLVLISTGWGKKGSPANNPVALHLHSINMLYEGLKQNSTIVIVPRSSLDTIQLGSMASLTALTMGIGQEKEKTQMGTSPKH